MSNKLPLVIGAVLGFIALLLICILVPLNFSYVPRQKLAFKRNTYTNDVDQTQVYANGRYSWGIGRAPVLFPSNLQRVNFTGTSQLSVFLDGGQTIYISIVFYYRIVGTKLSALYSAYGTEYNTRISSIARAALRNAAPQFVLQDYISNRANVSDGYFQQLQSALRTSGHVEVEANDFFLDQIQLPTTILTQKASIFLITQGQITTQYNQTALITRLTTNQLVAAIDSQASVVTVNATARGDALRVTATAQGFALEQAEVGRQLQTLISTLGLSKNGTAQMLQLLAILDSTRNNVTLVNVGSKGAGTLLNLR